MQEIWKDVKDYEGVYQISSLGRVKRIYPNNKERILHPNSNGRYMHVGVCNNGIKKTLLIHRLIAQAFIPNTDGKPQVNHINGDKTDNRVSNLEWVTASENTRHAFGTGLIKVGKGDQNKLSKPIIQYDLDGNFVKEWGCIMDIERELKIHHQHITDCCKGRHNKAGGYRWQYK